MFKTRICLWTHYNGAKSRSAMMTTSNLTSILSYCFVCTQENLENKALKLEARDYFERGIVYKEFLKFNGIETKDKNSQVENRCPRKFAPPPTLPPPLGNMAPPLRKFGPLENIVYFIAISSKIVKLLLKPRS